MNKKKEILFGIVILVLCVLLFAERLTGDIVHAVLGLLLIISIEKQRFLRNPGPVLIP